MSMRNVILAVVLWCFAMSTTLLLLSLWGRSVAHDRPAVTRAAVSISSRALSAQVAAWLAATSADLSPEVGRIVEEVLSAPEGRRALEALAAELVAAADVRPGTEVAIDPRPHLRPLVPLVAERLAGSGLPVEEASIEAAVDSVVPIVMETGGDTPLAGSLREARRILKLATLAAVAALVAFGGAGLWLAEDRPRMLRHLAQRVALSALGFAVFLRAGAWAADPRRGAAEASGTVREVASALLGSSLHVPLGVAAGAAVAALAARRWRLPAWGVDRPRARSYSPGS